ncbi:hypothetical protein MPER_02884, partial [Moniliophthora perniciosa FA553]
AYKLNKYLSIAKDNQYYILGTVLHPSMRSAWFQDYPYKSQEAVEQLFAHVANVYLDERTSEDSSASTPSVPAQNSTHTSALLTRMCSVNISAAPKVKKSAKEELEDEISRYLGWEHATCDIQKPLLWWKEHADNFPILACMARDFLAIPATSVSVERVYSQSRHICQDLWSALKAETVSEAMLSKAWIKSGLLEVTPPPRIRITHGSKSEHIEVP